MSFQKTVNITPAPAVEGDFASANPRASACAGPGELVADAAGVTVGRFAWSDTNGLVLNSGSGVPTGFVHRDMQALITTWLGEASMLIPQGQPVTLMAQGDFWARSGNAAVGKQKVFANLADGTVLCDTAGATVGATAFTASIAAGVGGALSVMSVSAVSSGTLVAGQEVSGASVAPGTTLVALLSGVATGVGTWSVSIDQVVASEAMTTAGYVETKWSVPAGFSCGAGELVKITSWN